MRANWSRELTARSRLALQVGREYQDSADEFRGDALDGLRFTETGRRGFTADPLVGSFGSIVYTLGRERATFRLGGRYQRDRYETDLLRDRDVVRLFGSVDYRLTSVTTIGFNTQLAREDFVRLPEGKVDELELTFRLARRLARQLDLAFAYTYRERSADIGRNYEENRLRLELVWTPTRR